MTLAIVVPCLYNLSDNNFWRCCWGPIYWTLALRHFFLHIIFSILQSFHLSQQRHNIFWHRFWGRVSLILDASTSSSQSFIFHHSVSHQRHILWHHFSLSLHLFITLSFFLSLILSSSLSTPLAFGHFDWFLVWVATPLIHPFTKAYARRNPGSLVNLALRTWLNKLHFSKHLFFSDRNPFLISICFSLTNFLVFWISEIDSCLSGDSISFIFCKSFC